MKPNRFAPAALAPLMILALAACSDGAADDQAAPPPETAMPGQAVAVSEVPGLDETGSPLPEGTVSDHVLTLDGLGALKIGQPLPKGGTWAERGAQTSDTCRLVSSPKYPGVYAIAEGGKVRRITVSEKSDVRTVEGIGFGSSRAQVDGAFPGFRESQHKYVEGGKYLTAPGAEKGNVAVRFELDASGKVTTMHVGTMPVLGYVEGCA
ncbi:MAG: hypothetical protein WBL74_04840 [Novosphingobium sp.]|uniref:hypothetical protein n=1 Tax=Novosphingobium sp. TaxID=1874826 RepID=UPI003C7BF9B8